MQVYISTETLKLPIESNPSSVFGRVFFSGVVVLVSNYHGCKGEAIKLILYYIIDVIYKIVNLSQLKKVQIIQNIKNLVFQVISTFSD